MPAVLLPKKTPIVGGETIGRCPNDCWPKDSCNASIAACCSFESVPPTISVGTCWCIVDRYCYITIAASYPSAIPSESTAAAACEEITARFEAIITVDGAVFESFVLPFNMHSVEDLLYSKIGIAVGASFSSY